MVLYDQTSNPGIRSRSLVSDKNIQKLALLKYGRELYQIVQASRTVPDNKKIELGVHVRDTEPTPRPRPATAPDIDLLSMIGRAMKVRLHDSTIEGRRKPAGVMGAAVFSYVGDQPPENTALWKFEANTTKTVFDIVFPETLAPGTKVWATAFWVNAKLQSGPPATPISALIQFGGMMAA
ncbi:MAG TPA: hypothetical protein VGR35_16685 [Tepidisphaeraceae bacterium]|nr:hypothetical protein [Tepidisphaeraceae bacterium]